jgi:hypothetical protein
MIESIIRNSTRNRARTSASTRINLCTRLNCSCTASTVRQVKHLAKTENRSYEDSTSTVYFLNAVTPVTPRCAVTTHSPTLPCSPPLFPPKESLHRTGLRVTGLLFATATATLSLPLPLPHSRLRCQHQRQRHGLALVSPHSCPWTMMPLRYGYG